MPETPRSLKIALLHIVPMFFGRVTWADFATATHFTQSALVQIVFWLYDAQYGKINIPTY